MAKIFYRYNSDTCLYEPIFLTGKQTTHRALMFVGLCLALALSGLWYYNTHYPSLDEVKLQQENQKLKWQWEVYLDKINSLSDHLNSIEHTDDNQYRVLLNMSPLDPSIRTAGSGGHEPYVLAESDQLNEIKKAYDQLYRINNRLDVESQSLAELEEEITVKEKMTSTRPAMMPIDNRQLTRFNSIFGMRLHPIYRDWRNHNGLDLTAPQGTPVYATGDGIITTTEWRGGYGNAIFLNHGFGFETRYGHLSRFNSSSGQHVKRGDLIGFVGSTGASTTPHLHYEVLYQGKYVNPINFMYRDLKQKEYNKIIKR
jgi:murein DD-endopeptidase MepM/ murein hydrolase activator NlpD